MSYNFILIGLTSGGPKALYNIIDKFDISFNLPIIIIQNLPIGFDKIFCEVFAEKAKLPIEVVNEETKLENKIYMAKAGHILDINEHQKIISIIGCLDNCITEFIKRCVTKKLRPIVICLAGIVNKNDPLEGLKIAKENDIPVIVQKIDENPNTIMKFETSLPETIIQKKYYTNIAKIDDIPKLVMKIIEKD